MEPEPSPSVSRPRRVRAAFVLIALVVGGLVAVQLAEAHGFGGPAVGAVRCRPQGLTESSGKVAGGCQSFQVDPKTGSLTSLAVLSNGTTVPLLDGWSIPALAGGKESAHRGYQLANAGVRLVAMDGPGALALMSPNGTSFTMTLASGATAVVHAEVADWSPPGVTITQGALKENLVLPPGSTVSQSGAVISVQAARGVSTLSPAGHPMMPGPPGGMAPPMPPRMGGFGHRPGGFRGGFRGGSPGGFPGSPGGPPPMGGFGPGSPPPALPATYNS
ncbi:MAG: hypothetical protein ACYDBQ_05285 [Thermoplasmatota archaeon]